MSSESLRSYAAAHPRQAQWIITFLLTATGFACFFFGLFVVGSGWYEAQWPLWITLAVLGGLGYIQVVWKDKAPSRRAWFAFHLSVVLAFASLTIHLGSRFPSEYGGEVVETSVESAFASANHSAQSQIASTEIQAGRSWVKRLIRKGKRSVEELPVWAKILLTILVIAAVIAVGYVAAALACALVCSEMGALAAIVIIVGWLGAIVGGVFLIRRILRGKKKKRRPQA